MRGKVRMLFLAVLMVALAGVSQAEMMPLGVGYSWTYTVEWAGATPSEYTAFWQVTGVSVKDYGDGQQWWTVQLNNWEGDGQSPTIDMRATDTVVYFDGSANPHFKIGAIGETGEWTNEDGHQCQITAYDSTNNVYTMVELNAPDSPEKWKPGVGFLGESIPNYKGQGLKTLELKDYSTSPVPVPPSLLLLGSGLVGLLGLRKFRRS